MKLEFNLYDPNLIKPMRDEVTSLGFKELFNIEQVEHEINKSGTTLVFVNSVCGCAAGKARPGLKIAMEYAKENNILPDNLLTVFAGMEKSAVSKVREYFKNLPASSPQIALFNDGKFINIIQRNEIENSNEFQVAEKIIAILKENYRKD